MKKFLFTLAALCLLAASCSSTDGDQVETGADPAAAPNESNSQAEPDNRAEAPAAAGAQQDEPESEAEPDLESDAASESPAAAEDAPDPTPLPTVDFPTGINPIGLKIPSLGVDAATISLDLTTSEPEVPTDFDDTGWYRQTRRPGEIGPAVIAGHIDSASGPAVFAQLDTLVPGDEIIVVGDGGEELTFAVVDAEQAPKGDLPDSVFGFGEPVPELRLITCGGTFDAASGHYRDNYIVYARLV